MRKSVVDPRSRLSLQATHFSFSWLCVPIRRVGTRQGFKVQKPRDTSLLQHPSLVSTPRSNYICQSITEQMQVILMKIDSGTPSQKGWLVTSPGNLLAGFKALSHSQCGQSRLAPRQRHVTLEDPGGPQSWVTQGLWQEGPTQRWQELWAALCSALGQCCHLYPERLGGFYTGAMSSRCGLQQPPHQAGWFVNVLNSSASGGLTTERCFVSLPDTPAPRAGFTHTAGSGVVLLFEKLHPLDKPRGQLWALGTCRGWKVMRLTFLFFGGSGTKV